METLIHADIFFFVTTIAVVVVAMGLIWALVYIITILRDMRTLAGKLKNEGEEIIDDVHKLREETKKRGNKADEYVKKILGYFINKSKKK
jgi:uncharacterized protein YoxC